MSADGCATEGGRMRPGAEVVVAADGFVRDGFGGVLRNDGMVGGTGARRWRLSQSKADDREFAGRRMESKMSDTDRLEQVLLLLLLLLVVVVVVFAIMVTFALRAAVQAPDPVALALLGSLAAVYLLNLLMVIASGIASVRVTVAWVFGYLVQAPAMAGTAGQTRMRPGGCSWC